MLFVVVIFCLFLGLLHLCMWWSFLFSFFFFLSGIIDTQFGSFVFCFFIFVHSMKIAILWSCLCLYFFIILGYVVCSWVMISLWNLIGVQLNYCITVLLLLLLQNRPAFLKDHHTFWITAPKFKYCLGFRAGFRWDYFQPQLLWGPFSLVPGLLSSADFITCYGVQKNENLKLVPGNICIFLRATSFACELTRRAVASQLDTCVFFPFTPDPTPHSLL